MISSLVLLTLSNRLFSVHHSARLLISSRYEVLLFAANDGGVVHELHNIVLSTSEIAVIGVQHEQEGLDV